MDSRKDIGVVGTIVAVIVAVVGVSVVWAAYTASLNISGSAVAENAKWSIIFDNLGTASAGNVAGYTSTAKELVAPEKKGDVSIETFKVSVKTPGDYISYTFDIKNDGDFPAQIDEGFEMPEPICKAGTGDAATTEDDDAKKVCNHLTYTLKYSNGDDVKEGDEFGVDDSKTVVLTLTYTADSSDTTGANLPKKDIAITLPDITIPFVQK